MGDKLLIDYRITVSLNNVKDRSQTGKVVKRGFLVVKRKRREVNEGIIVGHFRGGVGLDHGVLLLNAKRGGYELGGVMEKPKGIPAEDAIKNQSEAFGQQGKLGGGGRLEEDAMPVSIDTEADGNTSSNVLELRPILLIIPELKGGNSIVWGWAKEVGLPKPKKIIIV